MKFRDMQKNERFKALILEFRRKGEPTLLRNVIFTFMQKDLTVILKGILAKRGQFLDEAEILSLTWDLFEWFLSKYNPQYEVLPMLRRYTYFFIFHHFQRQHKRATREVSLEELESETWLDLIELPATFEKLDDLMCYREVLSDREKFVFDYGMSTGWVLLSEQAVQDLAEISGMPTMRIHAFFKGLREIFLPFFIGRKEAVKPPSTAPHRIHRRKTVKPPTRRPSSSPGPPPRDG